MKQLLKRIYDFKGEGATKHFNEKRTTRYARYKELGLLDENFIYFFVVNNNHLHGNEVHAINKHGVIYIYNQFTRLFITIKHPRPNVLFRYFSDLKMDVPNDIKEIAKQCNERNKLYNLNKI
jgi:hypothetical protein